MKIRHLAPAVLLTAAATLGLLACSSDDDASSGTTTMPAETEAADTTMPSATGATMLTGTFAGQNDKAVSGTVTIEGGELMLSGFSSDEGPDLHLYLADGSDEAAVSAGTELGAVAWDEAEQTFSLDGVDPSGFTTVVVHCDKAKATFGSADLA